MFKRTAAAVLAAAAFAAAGPTLLSASQYLLSFELQGLAGYSGAAKKAIFYSHDPMEAMQKPGLGFDYVQRFSGASGDIAVLAVQGRLAWNAEGDPRLEPQLYNAYLKFKTRAFDLWLGHNRPRFGLASVLDSHALLLQPLSMAGFGFDRDWGAGFERDTAKGTWGLSLTTGSGMGLRLRGNYFLAGRVSRGILGQDNLSVGFSLGGGRVLDVMGYHLIHEDPVGLALAALDVTWLLNNVEHRLEIAGGRRGETGTAAILWRAGWGFLEENRLKLEIQPSLIRAAGKTKLELAAGASLILHPDWTLRTMAAYDSEIRSVRAVVQIYFLKGILL